jgi:fumarylacetoacetase
VNTGEVEGLARPLVDPPAYGVGSPDGNRPRVLARAGEDVLDLAHLVSNGSLGGLEIPEGVFSEPTLNPFMALGADAWAAVDERVREVARTTGPQSRKPENGFHPIASARLSLPFEVADYCDFYASEEHASNIGRILRPGADPLPGAWRTLPLGYHGRAGTVVVSGTPVRRPSGVIATDSGPVRSPTRRLDLECEIGYVIGTGTEYGEPVSVSAAQPHIFGVVLVNDWSARDIQGFEYQPLGPFLGKSFATSISAWVVRIDALAPFRVDGPDQGPEVPAHLRQSQPRGIDLNLELTVCSTVLSRPPARHLRWSPEQFVAHLTSNGANLRTGDLLASGTVSGPARDTWGSLMELTWGGERPVRLADGTERTWLEDGDTVTIRAWCGEDRAFEVGEVSGAVLGTGPG